MWSCIPDCIGSLAKAMARASLASPSGCRVARSRGIAEAMSPGKGVNSQDERVLKEEKHWFLF